MTEVDTGMTETAVEGLSTKSHVDADAASLDGPILFYDGVCGLCHKAVAFVLKNDRVGIVRFAPLQGATASRRLPSDLSDQRDSMVFLMDGHPYLRSSAVVAMLSVLPGVWKVLGRLLWLVPRPIRDLGYRLVAASRYRFFGRYEACRLPSTEERERLMD